MQISKLKFMKRKICLLPLAQSLPDSFGHRNSLHSPYPLPSTITVNIHPLNIVWETLIYKQIQCSHNPHILKISVLYTLH